MHLGALSRTALGCGCLSVTASCQCVSILAYSSSGNIQVNSDLLPESCVNNLLTWTATSCKESLAPVPRLYYHSFLGLSQEIWGLWEETSRLLKLYHLHQLLYQENQSCRWRILKTSERCGTINRFLPVSLIEPKRGSNTTSSLLHCTSKSSFNRKLRGRVMDAFALKPRKAACSLLRNCMCYLSFSTDSKLRGHVPFLHSCSAHRQRNLYSSLFIY